MTILMFMVSSFGVQAPHHGLQESMAALREANLVPAVP